MISLVEPICFWLLMHSLQWDGEFPTVDIEWGTDADLACSLVWYVTPLH